jgi:hypothetical protein
MKFVRQWLAAGWWFSPCTPVSTTNKTDRHYITELLLRVALNTITLTPYFQNDSCFVPITCSMENGLEIFTYIFYFCNVLVLSDERCFNDHTFLCDKCDKGRTINFQGGLWFFSKKIFWFPMLLKKYSDFGGGKK